MKPILLRTLSFAMIATFGRSVVSAQVGTFTKAQVSDRIRKVEDGVDEFQKYLRELRRKRALKSTISTEQRDHNEASSGKFLSEGRKSVDVPYARCRDLQQVTVWIAEVERLASIFPRLPQLNRDALFLQPPFPSGQIRTSNPKRDVNCAVRVRIGSSAFFEQQQHATITRTHWAKARLVVQGFTGFERLKAEYSLIEFSGASRTLDVQGGFQNPVYSRWRTGDITHDVFLCRA